MKLTPSRKKYLIEIGYSIMLILIFAMGYFTGYIAGEKGDPMYWTKHVILDILIIKLIATGLTLKTTPDDHPKT
jgi:hypothetical protein